MEVPLLLQFSIALFTGMVAATFVPPVRRAIPRPVEIVLWVAFVSVCVLGVASITDRNARELSTSAIWGADQIFNTTIGLMLGGVGGWIVDHRFPIASWLVIIAGTDIFALMFIRSARSAQRWQPRVRLREWMEIPVAVAPTAASQSAAAGDPLAGVNRRIAAWGAIAGTAVLAGLVEMAIWMRDVVVPHHAGRLAQAAAAGRVESRARLDSLRDATAHLQYAARSWYSAAGEPVISDLAARTARAAKRSLKPVALRPGEIIDIQALLGAQSIGWYGPLTTGPMLPPGENDAAEPPRSDRLAS
ncbi:MAG TPA: hypothetical protein VFR33_01155 [Candidatus Dormibacteraeota bacterium]|nr:hypothetical protein [Candidatus Dormibacteraeota bacterium]